MLPLELMGIRKARKSLIPLLTGHVLEIGSGTGSNLSYYNMTLIDKLTISDYHLKTKLKKIRHEKIEVLQIDVQTLPFPDNSFDYIVHTLVFCSVENVEQGLAELKRVLKPGGKIVFIEHVLPEGKKLSRLVNFLNPGWSKISSGCNLNRSYEESLKKSNFEIVSSKRFLKTVFIYGIAQPITL